MKRTDEKSEGVISFCLPYPPPKQRAAFMRRYSLNAYYVGKHWGQRKADAQYWHLLVRVELRRQGVPQRALEAPAEITFYWDDRLDCDNHAVMGKLITDALKGWLLKDDTRRYVSRVTHTFHNQGCITVEIQEGKAP